MPDPSYEHLPSTSSIPPQSLRILAARILTKPPPPAIRLPRPDDPTPRKPPAQLSSAKRKRELSAIHFDLGSGAKRVKGKAEEEDEQVRMARDIMLNMPKPGALGKDVRMGSKGDVLFKVPEVPSRSLSRSHSESSVADTDVFGDVSTPLDPKVKSRAPPVDKPGSDELEKANKIVCFAWVRCLDYASHLSVRLSNKPLCRA